MIAKRVCRGKTKDGFKRFGLNILSEKKTSPPFLSAAGGTWLPTAAYVLDLSGGGQRLGTIRITNCAATEAAEAEIQAMQALNAHARRAPFRGAAAKHRGVRPCGWADRD